MTKNAGNKRFPKLKEINSNFTKPLNYISRFHPTQNSIQEYGSKMLTKTIDFVLFESAKIQNIRPNNWICALTKSILHT